MSDEGLREFQLNGKQLFFMFMAVTASAVVIFLCGVMVGRGVRTPEPITPTETTAAAPADPTASADATPPPAAATLPNGAPASAQETLTYPDRLEDTAPPPETLEEPALEKTTASTAPAPASTAGKATSAGAAQEPSGNGYVVQVAAVRERAEADTIARRLTAKGYPSFVTTPGSGAPKVFRVRVGKFADRHEADAVASKLQREEQFKPWVTR